MSTSLREDSTSDIAVGKGVENCSHGFGNHGLYSFLVLKIKLHHQTVLLWKNQSSALDRTEAFSNDFAAVYNLVINAWGSICLK